MIHKVKKKHTKKQVLGKMLPLIRTWFDNKFDDVTEPQAYAIPIIHERKNVLISSPTGSGKTLTAFLSIINELLLKQNKGELEDKIYCVYVSPLKALANDIDKNLKQPLAELSELAKEMGEEAPDIRVGVRTGDTTSYERQKMARKPPHILITTPESLAIVLTTPKFSENLKNAEWLITDEIHEMCNSKRGSMLSVTLERLQSRIGREATRIGLSATQSPIEEIGKFLGGYEGRKTRDVWLVQAEGGKDFDIKVVTPVNDITSLPFEIVNARMYEKLKEMVDKTRTTLVFTNTRSGTEQVMLKLSELGLENIAAHHGSLSRETRLDVEDRLKDGELKAVVSSTSLELGIDIGTIDLVCQIGSPKSIAKGLQRVGRSGHGVGEESKGRFMVFDNDDLVECAVLAKSAVDHDIDRVSMPHNPLDVLAQTLVGLSLERRWGIDEAYLLVKNSYTFHSLSKKDYMAVLRYLGSRDMPNVYSKLWLDEDEGTFGAKKGSRLIYYLNSGTIPEEANFKVFSDKGGRLGELSEGFVEKLSQGDVFVLGGKSYKFERARGMSLFVTDATGRRPTVPSWTGEMLPRSFDLSVAIGNFRRLVGERIAAGDEKIKDWLVEEYHLDDSGANSILSYFREQLAFDRNLPTDDELLVEGHIDSQGNHSMIFHFCFGRRVNDALSRAYAMAISDKFNINVSVSITDDNFMLTLPKHIPLSGLDKLVKEGELVELLERAIIDTEIFKHRFRHCSTRGFMVLRNYKGREVPVGRQMQRSQKVLRAIKDAKNFPIVKETYSEIMNSVMDLKNASDVVKSINDGSRNINYSDYKDIPSPFAHNVVLAGMSDIVLMHDRTMLLKELHRKVLERIGGAGTIKPEFESQRVVEHFSGKVSGIVKKGDIIPFLRKAGPMELFLRKGRSVYDFSDVEPEELALWCRELVTEGKVHSVWAGRSLWAAEEMAGNYATVYRSEGELTPEGKIVLDILENADGCVSIKEISKGLAVATEMEWDSATTRKILTTLERQFLVAKIALDKKNYPLWGLLAVKPKGNRNKLVEKIITGQLELFGPMSKEELAFELKLLEAEIEMVVDKESATGQLMSGAFTESYIQYMLAQDYAGLRNLDGGLLIPRDRLARYWLEKHFTGFDNIDDYFERYGSVGSLNDVAARLGLDGLDGWGKLRKEGEVLQGRFWDGSVCFVRRKDAPAFINAYRNEELGKMDKQVLDVIDRNPGSDILKVQEITDLPKDSLKTIIEKLDRNMHIARLPADRAGLDPNFESWSTRNRYYRLKSRRSSRDGKEWLVNKVITAYGPVSLYDIARQIGVRRGEAMDHVKELLGSGKLAEVSVMGSEGQKLYVWKKELDSLASPLTGEEKDEIRILTIFDPFSFHHRNEIRMKFGDAWYYTIFHGPRLVGMMEMWEMSGCLEIRELALDEPELLPEVLEALDNFAEFYRKNYLNVIRFTGALGVGVEELDKKASRAFKKAGYSRSRNWLLKGELIELAMSDEEMVSYLLWKQHIVPERRFDDVMTGLIELGGFKSDHETGVRVHDPRPLKKLHKEEIVEKGQAIPEFITYALPEEMELYKAAKHRKIDKNMKYIVTILDREHKMKWSQIIDSTPLSYTNATQALSDLVRGLHILKDAKGFHYLTPLFRYEKEEARERVLWVVIQSFGIFSAESLSLYTKAEFRMGEIRKTLAKFEKEGKLVKGFISPDDNTLYWLLKEDLPLLPMEKHDVELVLAPSAYDRLSTYLMPFIRKKFGMGSSFIVISGGDIIGAFGANLRRTELVIRKYVGDDAGWDIIKQYARSIGRRFKIKEEEEDGMSDEELMDWYDKISGRSID